MAVGKHIVAAFSLALTSAASAQDFPVMDWGPMMQTEAMNSVVEDIKQSEAARAARSSPSSRPITPTLSRSLSEQFDTGPARGASVAAEYVPTEAVRTKLAAIMGSAAGKQGKAQEQEMRALVLSGKAVSEYGRIAPMLGYKVNDAVDALAFYLLAQWGVANDYRPDITRTQARAVRGQAANAFAAVASQVATDAHRQEFAEMLVIQGVIMAGVHEAAVQTGDEAALKRYAALARQGGRQIFSVDPAAVILTDAGFRRR